MRGPVLVIDPKLGISADEIEALWNADPEASAEARLERVDIGPRQFDPAIGGMALTFVLGVASSVTATLLIAALRRLLAPQVPAEELEIDIRRDAAGNEQLIMRRKTG